jgi:hypothetical protein
LVLKCAALLFAICKGSKTCCCVSIGAGALHAMVMSTTALTGPQGDDAQGTLLNGGSGAVTDANGLAWVVSEWCVNPPWIQMFCGAKGLKDAKCQLFTDRLWGTSQLAG